MASTIGEYRYVALGDSFTEGLHDRHTDGSLRGWADRVAEELDVCAVGTSVRYANLAVRGKLLRDVVDEQLPRALAMRPQLVTIAAGGNDVLRPRFDADAAGAIFHDTVRALAATGARVVVFTGFRPYRLPLATRIVARASAYNDHIRRAADDFGCGLVDMWDLEFFRDHLVWAEDRLHLSALGHRLVAAQVIEVLGLDRRAAVDAVSGGVTVPGWRDARGADLRWAREHLWPFVLRTLRGVSTGDGRSAKRPHLDPVSRCAG